jgi:TonB family protein
MHRWLCKFALTASVLAVHAAALWALQMQVSGLAVRDVLLARVLPSASGVKVHVVAQPRILSTNANVAIPSATVNSKLLAIPLSKQTALTNTLPKNIANTKARPPQAMATAAIRPNSETSEHVTGQTNLDTSQKFLVDTLTSSYVEPAQPSGVPTDGINTTRTGAARTDAKLDADHADTQYRHPYPAFSKKLAEEGQVLLRVVVDGQGKPTGATIAQSSGYARLDDAGLQTVMRWRFKPATVNGVPESQSVVLQRVTFNLKPAP